MKDEGRKGEGVKMDYKWTGRVGESPKEKPTEKH